jgi:probable F420-dependent oxidoreductase
MSPRVEVGIAVPQTFSSGPAPIGILQDFIVRAETLGMHSLWVQEQIIGGAPSLDPVDLLAYAAALTRRVRLGVAVLLPVLRSPVHLAKSLATVDHLSQGRLIVGIGLGGETELYPAFGISAEHRVARFSESLRLMQQLWTEPRVTFEGRFWKLDGASMEPKPVQRPHPPVWFGAHEPPAIRRAVELGSGFIGAGAVSVAQFREQVTALRGYLAEGGRDPMSFPVSKRVYIAVDENEARGRARLREWFTAFYGNGALAGQVAVCGGPRECLDQLAEVVAIGASLLILNPVFDETQQLGRIVAEIVPKLSPLPTAH